MGLRLRLLNIALRLFEKRALARGAPLDIRRSFERKGRVLFGPTRGSVSQWDELTSDMGTSSVLRVRGAGVDDAAARGTLFHIHGGGFVFGSPETHAGMLARLSQLSGMDAILPKYRLAPEHRFPAGFDDIVAAYVAVVDDLGGADKLVLGGDSAGGGLVFSLLHHILEQGLPKPAAIYGMSPLADMHFSGASFADNAKREAILPASRASEMAKMYLGEQSPDNPQVSPMFGVFTGAPPSMIMVGDTEILLDDARRLAKKIEEDGSDVELIIRPDYPHVWPYFHRFLREADADLVKLAEFSQASIAPVTR